MNEELNAPKKSIFTRWWFWVIIIVIIGGGFAFMAYSGAKRDQELARQQQGKKTKASPEEEMKPEQRAIKERGPKPTISLPFSTSQVPAALVPMGETIAHPDPPNPGGHPGIDFTWASVEPTIRIISSMDSAIVELQKEGESYTVRTEKDGWGINYGGVEPVNPELKVGSLLKTGDYIGIAGHGEGSAEKRMIHWEFGYFAKKYNVHDRLCPLTYFDPASKTLIEKIWAKTGPSAIRTNAPDICSNFYKAKDE